MAGFDLLEEHFRLGGCSAAFGTESISIIFQEGCLSSRASVWKILEVGFNVLFQLCFFFSNCRFDTIYSINRVGF